MKSITCKWLFAVCFCWLSFSSWAATATQWQTLSPGLEYTRIDGFANFPNGYVHAFRIDPNHYDLQIAAIPSDMLSDSGFEQLMTAQHAVIATNGGFFTPNLTPLGLRINQGQLQNPLKSISWWAIFYMRGEKAQLVRSTEFRSNAGVDFAVQAGPRLVVSGKVVSNLKPDIDERTALGISRRGKVILLATQDLMLSMPELAALMQRGEKDGGLDCKDAMNLDGGSSTQMYARIANFTLEVPSSSRVADAVLVVPSR